MKDEQQIRDGQRQLQALSGKTVRMWHYTSSHDRLTYRVFNKSGTHEHYLHFLSCVDIQSPTLWTIKNPSLSLQSNELFVFTDDGVRIICADVQATEEDEREKGDT